MQKIDALRFVKNIPKIFAPSILPEQVFIAYTDEDTNSFTIQGDNLSSAGSSEALNETLNELEQSLQQKITKLQTAVTTLQQTPQGIDSETMNDALDALEDRVQAKLDALQASIPEQQQDSQASGSSITIVDDIVYGLHSFYNDTPNLDSMSKENFRGRPCLCAGYYTGLYLYDYSKSKISDEIMILSSPYGAVYAGFGDGKFHTVENSDIADEGIVSTPINNGDYIMNKADNCLYTFDASQHRFVKVSGNRHYVVDYIVDYVGTTLPNEFKTGESVFADIRGLMTGISFMKQGSKNFGVDPMPGVCFANIQSVLSDQAGIYVVEGSSYDEYTKFVRVIHDLYEGDTLYNKFDGCFYSVSSSNGTLSFVRFSQPLIDPVMDIMQSIGSGFVIPSAVGAKSIWIPSSGSQASLYIAAGSGNLDYESWEWDHNVQNGDRYASLADHKIFEFFMDDMDYQRFNLFDISIGASFFNEADQSLYFYNGSDFVKISSP